MTAKIFAFVLVILIALIPLFSAGSSGKDGGVTGEEISVAAKFGIEIPESGKSSFTVKAKDGGQVTFDKDTNTYVITAAGEYDAQGELYEGQLVVDAGDDDAVTINLQGVLITNSSLPPLYLKNADKVELSAKKNTLNRILDIREKVRDEEDSSGGAIYAECDLNLKGNGFLEVYSSYNNGIHTKDDLKIKNLSLSVLAVNNAIKGNDSITVESGTILAASTEGDALKTTNTDLSKKGVQRGTVTISGGTLYLYAACDGIDAATDVVISGDATVEIFTDEFSPYTSASVSSDSERIYLRLDGATSSSYTYKAFFHNGRDEGVWVDGRTDTSSQSAQNPNPWGGWGGFGQPGGRGGMGGFQSASYTYISFVRPEGYSCVTFHAYSGNEEVAVSEKDSTIPLHYDTYAISSISSGIMASSGWTARSLSSGKLVLDHSAKGIKTGNSITVDGGTVTILAKDDGLHSNFDEVLESTGEKGLGNITISGGSITVSSGDDGIHADQDIVIEGGTVRVLVSYEAIEANRIYIRDGEVTVYASDDAVNANSKGAYQAYVEISGGYLDATVPSGDTDTVDSNGTVLISGGFVFLKNGNQSGSSFTGGTLDTDRGVTVTGGTVIAIGCIGNSFNGGLYSTGITFNAGDYAFVDDEGNTVLTFSLESYYRAIIMYSDMFEEGVTYSAVTGDTVLFQFKI